MDSMQDQSASQASAAIGAIIFSIFGSAWLIAWSIKAYGERPDLWALIAILGMGILFAAFRQFKRNKAAHAAESDSPESKRASRVFNIVNIGQGIAILVAVNVTNNIGLREWFIPVFIFIIGAHFLPLAVVFKTKRHWVTGSAMILLAVLYPQFASGGPADPVGCLGTGIILWASAITGLLPEVTANARAKG
jgi:MFS family permease